MNSVDFEIIAASAATRADQGIIGQVEPVVKIGHPFTRRVQSPVSS